MSSVNKSSFFDHDAVWRSVMGVESPPGFKDKTLCLLRQCPWDKQLPFLLSIIEHMALPQSGKRSFQGYALWISPTVPDIASLQEISSELVQVQKIRMRLLEGQKGENLEEKAMDQRYSDQMQYIMVKGWLSQDYVFKAEEAVRQIQDDVFLKNKANKKIDAHRSLRTNFAYLTLISPFVHAIAAICQVIYTLLKTVSFYHFWRPAANTYGFIARISELGNDLARMCIAPGIFFVTTMLAIKGLISNPYVAKVQYMTMEKWLCWGIPVLSRRIF